MRICPHRIGEEIEFNDSTNPNVVWASTTWTQITDGRVTLASSNDHALGSTGGSKTISYTPQGSANAHKLTESEIPSHSHPQSLVDSGTRTGVAAYNWTISNTGRFYSGADLAVATGGNQAHSHGFTGTAATLNVMQPWRAVNRWKRVA